MTVLCGTVDDLIETVLKAIKEPEHHMRIVDLNAKRPNDRISDPANRRVD